jgi:replicative DNA helicase
MMPNGIEALAQPAVPVSLASEREVLGALIDDAGIFSAAMEVGLSENFFFYDAHRKIFLAILALTTASQPVDVITVAEKLGNKAEDLALVGDLLSGCVLVPSHICYHVELLRRTAYLRNCLEFAEWLQSAACAASADPEAIEREARIKLNEMKGLTDGRE